MENYFEYEKFSTTPPLVTPKTIDRVDRAMSRLSAKHGEILILIDVKNISYDATAALLDIPVKDMRKRLASARHNFERLMRLQC